MNRVLSFVAGACAALCMVPAPAQAQGRPDLTLAALRAGKAPHAPGELLLQLRRGISAEQAQAALDRLGASRMELVRSEARRSDGKGDLLLVRLPKGVSLIDAVQRAHADAVVDFAEPNWIAKLDAQPIDPLYADGSLWGLYGDASPKQQNAFGSQAGEAAAAGKVCDESLVVGMIDAGVMNIHEDLAANIWVNPNEAVNGIDDDGNGLIDDVNGWNFRGKTAKTFKGSEDDHGTHTSGTIGAVRLNNLGVAGVCDKVQIISAKAFGTVLGIGRTNDIIAAVDYITDLKVDQGINIVVTNNSWGGTAFSQATLDAYIRHTDAGIIAVASAGNNAADSDSSPSYPAAFDLPRIISVAAIERDGALAVYSNYGATTVDIGAPGTDVVSTLVGPKVGGVNQSAYGALSGTSMAAPHVTGAVLLYKSLHPDARPGQIKRAILESAVPTPSLAGKTVTGGRLDVSGF